MNFFGHAVVAAWHAGDRHPALGALALGAMLPDLLGIAGARLDHAGDDHVDAGIALHHRTDAAFHPLPEFVALGRRLDARLTAGGVSRGPARATAHVGVELLLDGVLAEDRAGRAAYLAALAHPADAARWREPAHGPRFAQLRSRLAAHGVPDDLRDPAVAASRLLRALAPRPRLCPSAAEADVIRAELAALVPEVERAAPAIVGGLRAALGLAGGG